MPRRRPIDPDAQHELELHIDNTERFYNDVRRVEEMLARGICRRTRKRITPPFSVARAATAFRHIMLDAAHDYSRERSSGRDGARIFSAATRDALAQEYAKDFKSRVNLFLQKGVRDITPATASTLMECAAQPLAGHHFRRRRR